jgi:hypothetical protein
MHQGTFARAAALGILIGLAAAAADGKTRADCEAEYTPQRAQEGKDVIWVPTEDAMVERMLEMAGVTAADKVYDLGAGDGKIPIAAAKRFGATAVGVEYDPDLVRHAHCLVAAERVEHRVTIIEGDLFDTDFSDATVVTLYLLPDVNLRLRPRLLDLPPDTRVVSHSFGMGDWKPDEEVVTDDGVAYLWIVPARVDGAWTFQAADGSDSFDVTFEQAFQELAGVAGTAAVSGTLRGSSIELAFVLDGMPTRIAGTVDGECIRAVRVHKAQSITYDARRPGSRDSRC